MFADDLAVSATVQVDHAKIKSFASSAPTRALPGAVLGKRTPVGTDSASVYGDFSMQVASAAREGNEPLLNVRIGCTTFRALLDTGSSMSLLGPLATSTACSSGGKRTCKVRTLRLASCWSQSSVSTKCRIERNGGSRVQKLLSLPNLCQDVVLGRDFLTATG